MDVETATPGRLRLYTVQGDQSFSHREEEEGGVSRLEFILLSSTRNQYSPHFKLVIYFAFLKKVPHMLWLLEYFLLLFCEKVT